MDKDNEMKILFELEELKKNVNVGRQNTSSKINKSNLNIEQKILTLEENITNKQTQLEDLQLKINQLQELVENSGGGSGGGENLSKVAKTGQYVDILNRPDYYQDLTGMSDTLLEISCKSANVYNLESEKLYFTCSPDTPINGNLFITFISDRRNYTVNEKFSLVNSRGEDLGAGYVKEIYNGYNTVRFDFTFQPYKEADYIYVKATRNLMEYRFALQNLIFNFTSGRNLFFLNKAGMYKICEYRGSHVILNLEYSSFPYYSISDKNIPTSQPTDLLVGFFHYARYSFGVNYSNSVETMVDVSTLAVTGDYDLLIEGTLIHSSYRDTGIIDDYVLPVESYGTSSTYFREKLSLNFIKCPTICGILTDGKVLFKCEMYGIHDEEYQNNNFSFYVIKKYELNGQLVQDESFIENIAVTSTDLVATGFMGFKGSVARKVNGDCVFYPSFNSTYCIELGRGRRVHALYNANTDIDVYLGQINCVIRKTLRLNSLGVYEIFSVERIYGFDECFETSEGHYFGIYKGKPCIREKN